MDKINMKFEQEDLNNLLVFLERIELKGKEVPAYNKIMFNINGTIKELQK